ncbi:MAG: tRNA-binding protein [Bacteroidota bacterium]
MAEWKDFESLDIRIGTIKKASEFSEAKKPAYKLEIDFGSEIGILKSSAQIKDRYAIKDLTGRQIIAIINFPEKQIANFFSQCLVLGVYTEKGVALLSTEEFVPNGSRIG